MKSILKVREAKRLMGLEVHQDGDKTTPDMIFYVAMVTFLDDTSYQKVNEYRHG